mgnify:CR=1 FL=1
MAQWQRAAAKTAAGFSLVELLVVLLIVGLGISLVSLSIGGDQTAKVLRESAEKFSNVAKLAAEEAVLGGEPIGLTLVPGAFERGWQYYWQRYRDGSWQPVGEPLDRRELSPLIRLELEIEGRFATFDGKNEGSKETGGGTGNDSDQTQGLDQPLPAIVFFPSGEATVFTLTFASDNAPEARQQVSANMASHIQWKDGSRDDF